MTAARSGAWRAILLRFTQRSHAPGVTGPFPSEMVHFDPMQWSIFTLEQTQRTCVNARKGQTIILQRATWKCSIAAVADCLLWTGARPGISCIFLALSQSAPSAAKTAPMSLERIEPHTKLPGVSLRKPSVVICAGSWTR